VWQQEREMKLQIRERKRVLEKSVRVGTRVKALGTRKDHWMFIFI